MKIGKLASTPFPRGVRVRKFPSGDARKLSLYFPQEMADHVAAQAVRLDRSKSWVVQECIRLSRATIEKLAGPPEIEEDWQPQKGVQSL
jgi:uncharacterized small protein (TIGR04563 family)